jgi:transposase
MEKPKRTFDATFKKEALALLETSGKPLAQVARDLGISDNTLQGWKQQMREHGQEAFPGNGHQTPQDEEMRRFRRENEILRQERDMLKKPHIECLLDELMGNQLNLAF